MSITVLNEFINHWNVHKTSRYLISLGNSSKMDIDFGFSQNFEIGVILGDDTYFDLTRLEVSWQNCGQTIDSQLNRFIKIKIAFGTFFELFLQERISFCSFWSNRTCLKSSLKSRVLKLHFIKELKKVWYGNPNPKLSLLKCSLALSQVICGFISEVIFSLVPHQKMVQNQ